MTAMMKALRTAVMRGHPRDSPADQRLRAHFFGMLLATAVSGFSMAVAAPGSLRSAGMFTGAGVAVLAQIGLLLGLPMRGVLFVFLLVMVVAIFITDYGMAADTGSRAWTVVVVVTDLALVFLVRQQFLTAMVAATAVYLTFAQADLSVFGFYQTARESFTRESMEACSCADPPCLQNPAQAFTDLGIGMFIFLMDFGLTQSFSLAKQRQIEAVQAAVKLTAKIVQHLTQYEVDEAEADLETESAAALPCELKAVYLQLLQNLRQYKPFLPMSCLVADADRSESSRSVTGHERESTMESHPQSCTSSTQVVARSPTSFHVRQDVRLRRLSLLCANQIGFLPQAAPESASELVRQSVHWFESAVKACGGVVDQVGGDHYFGSFNGAKMCGSHRISAARCTGLLTKAEQWTSAVVSGCVLCGDFGTVTTVRYMVLDRLVCLLMALERVGAVGGVPALCDPVVESDVANTWQRRLHTVLRYPRKMPSRNVCVWELLAEKKSDTQAEWMYELMTLASDPWQGYNEVVESWARDAGEPLQVCDRLLGAPCPPDVADALRLLRRRIQSGAVPVLVVHEMGEACCRPTGDPILIQQATGSPQCVT